MRRERDDESRNTRHDGTSQRHGRGGNTGRIPAGLLKGELAPQCPRAKRRYVRSISVELHTRAILTDRALPCLYQSRKGRETPIGRRNYVVLLSHIS